MCIFEGQNNDRVSDSTGSPDHLLLFTLNMRQYERNSSMFLILLEAT